MGNAVWSPDLTDVRQLAVHYSLLPRAAISLLCGASLALAGVLFQQVMRNPLASPTTLGASAGASLALTVVTTFMPGILLAGREAVALSGAAAAVIVVFILAARQALSPLAVTLAGMVVALYAGSAAALLQLIRNPLHAVLSKYGAPAR